jgi:EAL and modified HD-GYP domain-containing signal transduction protein
MAARSEVVKPPETTALAWDGEMRTVARQPILNLGGRLHAYELLFRDSPAAGNGAETAIDSLIDESVVFGLERLTNGFPAFIACTVESLTRQLVKIFPSRMTVLAIPASIEPGEQLIDICRQLKAEGFRLALDGFNGQPHPLLEMASYVRVDFSVPDAVGRESIRPHGSEPAAMVAKNVDTQEDYRRATAQGFTFFQGDYLFRPSLLKNRKIPANRLFHFEILQNLYRDPVDLRKLAKLVQRDASLTFRLLRLVNSPICALRQEVRSVETAIVIVGLDTFRRFAMLAILGDANPEQPPEILHTALVRARFCEQAAPMCRLNPSEQYLLGLFSLLPAMMDIPMNELTGTLPLRDEILQALEGKATRDRCLLAWLEHHERANWLACDEVASGHRLSREKLIRHYGDAVVWAQAALKSATATA